MTFSFGSWSAELLLAVILWQQLSSNIGGRINILYEAYMRQMKKGFFFCFYRTSFHPNSIPPNNDQVHTIMTAASYSSDEHQSASSSLQWVEQRRERKTIMFLSSKLCLLIALLLGCLLMDITFHAVPQAAMWSSAFWNERLYDAPLKLVQHGIIHHQRHSQRGAAASPCLPVTMGLQRELLSATSQCCVLHWTTEIALLLHFKYIWNSRTTVVAILGAILKVLPPCIYPVLR